MFETPIILKAVTTVALASCFFVNSFFGIGNGWKEGTIIIDDSRYRYEGKVYDQDSEFGIDQGRVSKLRIIKDNKLIINYDRGWDIVPDTEEEEKAFTEVMDKLEGE